MKKIWRIVGLIFVTAAVVTFYSLTQLKIVNGWNDDENTIVLANKVWKVHFSGKIDEKTVQSDLIYVTDDKGVKQKNDIFLSDDRKTIYISPPTNGYDPSSKMYTLHLEKGIRSTLGREMPFPKIRTFYVKETLPVVGSQTSLNSYFLRMIKEQKKSGALFKSDIQKSKESASMDMANSDSAARQDVSETNVQVQGVDEADIAKTDEKNIFQAGNNKVDIISALPASQMKQLATINYNQSFRPSQLFLHEDQLRGEEISIWRMG
jgi:inhibitor of cysteine peptidase